MAREPLTELKTRETDRANPKCLLRWAMDPATGKPMARWTIEQPEKTANFELRPAA
jgi:hypothetical protein